MFKTWNDYLLINQLEISNIRISNDQNLIVVGISNKHSKNLMYLLIFRYWSKLTLPDFNLKTMCENSSLSAMEINQLRARVQKVLNFLLQFHVKEDHINEGKAT